MAVLCKLSDLQSRLLEEKGIGSDELLLLTYCDMNNEHITADTLVGLDTDTLFVLSYFEKSII